MGIEQMIIIEGNSSENSFFEYPVYYWDRQLFDSDVFSISAYVEANADRLRKKYLDFVHDLGEKKLNGFQVGNELIQYKGYSLWWMSTIVEKNLVKSPAISDCIKMLALEEILLLNAPKTLKVYANNFFLIKSIKYLAAQLNIRCIIYRGKEKGSFIDNFKKLVPSSIKGLFYLVNLYFTYQLSYRRKKFDWHSGGQQLFIFSQFINFRFPADRNQPIYSKYWETLPFFLNKRGIKMTFLNHFHFSKQVRSVKEGFDLLKCRNINSFNHGEIHHLLPNCLNSTSIMKVLLFYISVHLKRFRIIHAADIFRPNKSKVSLWYFLRNDWRDSVIGTVLIENLLFIEAIEFYFQQLPQQNLGLFLQENNGWERAFVLAWKKYQQSNVIGVAHATMRYWDLRYYEHESLFSPSTKSLKIPIPDYIAVNGPVAEEMLLNAGFSSNGIIRVEALRYLNINNIYQRSSMNRVLSNEINVIVCGDIDKLSTVSMLKSLKKFIDSNSKSNNQTKFKFTYKSHPVNEIDLNMFGLNQIKVSNTNLSDILNEYDIALVTDSTTAGVEAYLAGLGVIVFSYAKRLNFSPLRDVRGVNFAYNDKQLADCLTTLPFSSYIGEKETFFWDDSKLPKWDQLFSQYFNYN